MTSFFCFDSQKTMPSFLFYLFIAFIAAALGSFTTMLIHRLHYDEKGIFSGRSKCPLCQKILKPKNLLPVFSWMWQRGRCAFCRKKISVFYPSVELIFIFTYLIFAYKFRASSEFWPVMIALFFILVLFFYDVRFYEVDRRVSLPAIFFAFIWIFFREISISHYLVGGVMGFGFYALLYFGSRGRWVGAGDAELGLFMGFLLGWKQFIMALFLANFLGVLLAIPLLFFKKASLKTALPMGAFLMPATLIFLYAGETIWNAYWQMVGVI